MCTQNKEKTPYIGVFLCSYILRKKDLFQTGCSHDTSERAYSPQPATQP